MKYLLLFFIAFLSAFTYSQEDNLYGIIEFKEYGTIYGVGVNYASPKNRLKVSKITKSKNKKSPNPIHLYFNSEKSLYNLGSKLIKDIPDKSLQINKGEDQGAKINVEGEGDQLFYRNFKTKEIYFHMGKAITDAYVVKDDWVEINWKIREEYKEILGYKVQKAEGYFRGKKHVAWFTRKIPHPVGPWKLFGLPGAILETYDPQFKNGIIAQKICYPCEKGKLKTEIEKPQEKITRTIEEHVFQQDHLYLAIDKVFSRSLKGNYMVVLTSNDTITREELQTVRKFSQEVQYEWEAFPGDTPQPENFYDDGDPLPKPPKARPLKEDER